MSRRDAVSCQPFIGLSNLRPADDPEKAGIDIMADETNFLWVALDERGVDFTGKTLDTCGPGATFREIEKVVDIKPKFHEETLCNRGVRKQPQLAKIACGLC